MPLVKSALLSGILRSASFSKPVQEALIVSLTVSYAGNYDTYYLQ